MSVDSFKCYCGDWRFKNAFFVIDEVREKVCRNLPFYAALDGKEYCVLHYPNKNKLADFDVVFQERLEDDDWDFRMVYFPKELTYEDEEFDKDADFGHATFAESVKFRDCKFKRMFTFFDSIFLESAYFFGSNFYSHVNFNAADFRKTGDFAGVTFHVKSYPSFSSTKFKRGVFRSAKFEKPDYNRKVEFCKAVFFETADFSNSEFFQKADFKNAVLPENGKTDFDSVNFHESVSFENVEFYDADFKGAKFASDDGLSEKAEFTNCNFKKSVAFVDATFFRQAIFEKSIFQNVHFENATFAGSANFRVTQFLEDAFFYETKFGYKDERRISSSQVNFDGANFGDKSRVFFDNTWFSWHTNFDYAHFGGYVFFVGSEGNPVFDSVFERHAFWSLLFFLFTTIEKPEKVYFHSVRLRPSWFVNLDCRKFNFHNIDWKDDTDKHITINGELAIIEKRVKGDSKKLLARVFRQLSENAESSSRFDEASNFRQMAFECERLERKDKQSQWWLKKFYPLEVATQSLPHSKKAPYDLPHFLYRWLSGYGEKWFRAFCWLLLIWVAFALNFYFIGEFGTVNKKEHLEFGQSLGYSFLVMILQKPEPRPFSTITSILYGLETVFAPIQAALLALAIRRKFMR